ncbi:MAG: DUF4150 domain-containing protein [Smithella sp.]|jgi:uncharacterized Zn-binding protein involved in type VI secretion|nr:DUF4150 domain-containing protein [Smithella sp.]
MGSNVYVNGQGWSHKGSGGTAMNTAPDVCWTQIGLAVVPIPYPNVAKSSDLKDGSKTVKVEGQPAAIDGCNYSKSTGDEAGNRKGIISATKGDKAEFTNYSFDVKCEGKGICRNGDLMSMNNSNTIGRNRDSSAEPPPPKNPPPPKDTIRIKVVDHLSWSAYEKESKRFKMGHEENKPLSDFRFKIKLPDGSEVEATTDANGIIELKDQDPHGRYEITHIPDSAKLNNNHYLFSHAITPLKKR